jgi:hypothetical protein
LDYTVYSGRIIPSKENKMPETGYSIEENLAYISQYARSTRFYNAYNMGVNSIPMLLNSKNYDCTALIFSVGCANNPPERAPFFAEALAHKGERVEVLNFDTPVSKDAPEHVAELRRRIENMPKGLTLSLLESSYNFPNDDKSKDKFESFIQALIKRKEKHPDFKFVLLSSLGPLFSDYMFRAASQLVDNGFKLGHDLEIVHAYHIGDPVLVYRDMEFLKTLNSHTLGQKDAFAREFIKDHGGSKFEEPYYDERGVFAFPTLDHVNDLFDDLTQTSLNKAKTKHKR